MDRIIYTIVHSYRTQPLYESEHSTNEIIFRIVSS